MAESIRPYIVINGKSSREVSGLLIVSLPPISKPQMRVSAEEIDGRDGDIVTELGFSAYDKPVEIGLAGNYDIDEVISYFNQAGIITFSNEPDKYYKFAQYNGIDFEKLIRFKTATVIFHVQPFKYDTESNDAVFWNPENISITNEGNIYSNPELAIQGSGNVGITLNGSEVLSLDLGNTQQAIIIDSDAMNAYGTKSNVKELITDINPVQAGSGTPSPSNVREISGWNGCVVSRIGKNLLDGDTFADKFIGVASYQRDTINKTVSFSHATSAPYHQTVISGIFKPNTVYTFIFNYTAVADNRSLRIGYSDGTNEEIAFSTNASKTAVVKTSAVNKTIQDVYLSFFADGLTTIYYDESGVFEGTKTLNDFKKFVGSKYQQFFEGLMAGSYGYVDLSSLTWVYATSAKRWEAQNLDMYSYGSRSNDVLFENYKTDTTAQAGDNDKGFIAGKVIYIASTDGETQPEGLCIYPLETISPTITQPEINDLISAFGADLNAIVFGQTVFGGTLNVTTGLLTLTHAIVDLGSLTWSKLTSAGSTKTYFRTSTAIADAKKNTNVGLKQGLLCSGYPEESWTNTIDRAGYDGTICIGWTNNSYIGIYDTSKENMDASEFKNAMDGIELCYELASPVEIQLTAEEIQTFIGNNNIWSNTGDISECIYTRAGADVTTSGAIVSFEADASDLRDDILKNRLVTGNYDNLRLKAGANQIGITGDVDVIVLSNFSRWL